MIELYMNIKKYRQGMHMSQQELALKTGYTDRSSIAKIEMGQVDLPQSKILLFAKALCVSPGELMGNTGVSDADEAGLKTDERTLLNGYRQLDDMDKGIVQGEVRQLLRDAKYQKEKMQNA